jgi:hypothetical protein
VVKNTGHNAKLSKARMPAPLTTTNNNHGRSPDIMANPEKSRQFGN